MIELYRFLKVMIFHCFEYSQIEVQKYCSKPEHHAYQLYLGIEDIDHSRTKAYSPQTNGICERFHKTMQEECYHILFRKKFYTNLDELQVDIDIWLVHIKLCLWHYVQINNFIYCTCIFMNCLQTGKVPSAF